ncbi:MAG: iron-containing alcohol dehydrogenase [Lachnospiraceae bacterium]|nr:iron-containing alcohol dehydrogenase [Lachnospiraceae bacterium]
MYNFNYYTPTEVVFGKAAEEKTGAMLKKYGAKKVLLHYGSGSVIRSGLLNRIKKSLEEQEIAYVELGGVVPNPRLTKVYEGIELCRKEKVDFLLAVGGGSVLDSAKAIGYGLVNEGDVWDFYEHTRKASGCMPLGVVVTIAAAGSEMSSSSVITNEERGMKRGYNDDAGRPKFAIMNPELTMTLPAYQTSSGCADILMHTQERYFTSGGNMELTDSLAEGLMRTVITNAKILMEQPDNYDARAEILWASSLSHNGLTGCGIKAGDFVCHALEHEIGAMFDVAHGAGLAAVWGSWARYVYKDCLSRFVKFAKNVMLVDMDGSDEEIALAGIEALENFYRAINMPTNMRELGVEPTDEQIDAMAHGVALAKGEKFGSAKVLCEADAAAIYRMAR